MENKEQIIIIALVVLVIYLYYRQNQPNIKSNNQEIQNLKQQVNHYQTLYQKRVAKDLDAETLNSGWEIRYNQLESLNNQTNREKNELAKYQVLIEKKVEDLETSLLNLAKQKIKGKKDAEKLLAELETKWKQDKEKWQHDQQILQKLQNFHHLVEKSPSHSLDRSQVNQAEKLVEQITQPEIKQLASWMITDSAFVLGHNNLLTKLANQEDKLEGLREQNKSLTQKNQDLTEELKLKGEFYQQEMSKFNPEHQEQLRKINLLFDPQAANYEVIDFNGLYSLLQQIAERERERESKSKWWRRN